MELCALKMLALTCNVCQFIACHQFWCIAQIVMMCAKEWNEMKRKKTLHFINTFVSHVCNAPDLFAHRERKRWRILSESKRNMNLI